MSAGNPFGAAPPLVSNASTNPFDNAAKEGASPTGTSPAAKAAGTNPFVVAADAAVVAAKADASLDIVPEGWQAFLEEGSEDSYYYYNMLTGESTWDKPTQPVDDFKNKMAARLADEEKLAADEQRMSVSEYRKRLEKEKAAEHATYRSRRMSDEEASEGTALLKEAMMKAAIAPPATSKRPSIEETGFVDPIQARKNRQKAQRDSAADELADGRKFSFGHLEPKSAPTSLSVPGQEVPAQAQAQPPAGAVNPRGSNPFRIEGSLAFAVAGQIAAAGAGAPVVPPKVPPKIADKPLPPPVPSIPAPKVPPKVPPKIPPQVPPKQAPSVPPMPSVPQLPPKDAPAVPLAPPKVPTKAPPVPPKPGQ
jgi:hypothetical protein